MLDFVEYDYFCQLAWSQCHHLWEALAKRVWHTDTHLATMPKDLGQPVTAEILPKDTSSLLPRLWLFWKHSPTERMQLASATLSLCIQGPLLWFAPHTSRPTKYFSFTCFHGSWEDQRDLCVGASLLSQEAQQVCFGLSSECLFTQSLSYMLYLVSNGKGYTCNSSIRNIHRNIGGREGPLDALITFIFHPLICAQGIVRFFDMRPQLFTHNLSVLEGIFRPNPKY